MKRKVLSAIITIAILIATMFSSIDTNAANGTWRYSGGGWWYEYADGSYAHSEYVEGYWLDSAGWYDPAWNGSWKHNSTGWWFQSGSWYPTSQWLKIDGSWYYFKSNGYMASNEWVGNYYLKSNGVMAVNEWIGEYYVDNNGAWVPGKTKEKTPTNNNQNNNNQNNNNNNNNQNNNNNNNNNNQTTTHTHTWTTTYTTFEPNFNSKFVAIPVDGYDSYGLEILNHGWTNYNYIVCNDCHTEYASYADYRANDKCAIHTYTDSTFKNYDSTKTFPEYTYKKYVKSNGVYYETLNDYINDPNHGGSYGTYKKITATVWHDPEIISTETTCSGCGTHK